MPGSTCCRALLVSVTIGYMGCSPVQPASEAKLLLRPGASVPELKASGWINGPPPSWKELQGKVAVLDVWAFW